jgi:D-alanyl-lipoteichoic acid acyltransferase DltB (MBOAT superfamily)
VPLGGGRVSSWAFNLALVFIVSGLWHGAGWNFILWGAVHAGYLICLASSSFVKKSARKVLRLVIVKRA